MTTSELEVIAPADEPVIITHRFIKARPELVFAAWTTPEHVRQWMGPRELVMVSCEIDLRVGERYRYVHRAPDGQVFGFGGKYLEIDPPRRLVCTSVFEMMPEHEAVETLTLEAKDGGTLITTHTRHATIAGRDGHLSGGQMEAGMAVGYDRLEELVERLSA
jgi:uncharacterized protein YndB with AHSA1/START domain